MATRYGVLPSEIANLDNDSFALNLLTVSVGTQAEAKRVEEAARKAKGARRHGK